ncbi:MAG: hypothetical protein AVDCRST_MAG02-1456 [uncultured Rubrobacteraceae bacterium]|uniref:Uncharacterized protein n=1 Tax=uncultured Rubrobacteraceae bacterium TaxID=349277 RepID=A0A6J4QU32_9ACTN|nr:MAG: hypothetical protein AVDCRST_MAG02-1456 [uncultured Rubrobacteraceae bacterium]
MVSMLRVWAAEQASSRSLMCAVGDHAGQVLGE